MIDIIMNVLMPSVSGDMQSQNISPSEKNAPNGDDFGQLLGIVMAQMGFPGITFPQNSMDST